MPREKRHAYRKAAIVKVCCQPLQHLGRITSAVEEQDTWSILAEKPDRFRSNDDAARREGSALQLAPLEPPGIGGAPECDSGKDCESG